MARYPRYYKLNQNEAVERYAEQDIHNLRSRQALVPKQKIGTSNSQQLRRFPDARIPYVYKPPP